MEIGIKINSILYRLTCPAVRIKTRSIRILTETPIHEDDRFGLRNVIITKMEAASKIERKIRKLNKNLENISKYGKIN